VVLADFKVKDLQWNKSNITQRSAKTSNWVGGQRLRTMLEPTESFTKTEFGGGYLSGSNTGKSYKKVELSV
jgi:hypothetical protein